MINQGEDARYITTKYAPKRSVGQGVELSESCGMTGISKTGPMVATKFATGEQQRLW